MNHGVRLSRSVASLILAEARAAAPLESCGLLAGPVPAPGELTVLSHAFPAPNSLASPSAYEISPADLFRLFREIRAAGLVHLGIYHSHPASAAYPSPTDIARAFYPEAVYLIASLLPAPPAPLRAFRIRSGILSELSLHQV